MLVAPEGAECRWSCRRTVGPCRVRGRSLTSSRGRAECGALWSTGELRPLVEGDVPDHRCAIDDRCQLVRVRRQRRCPRVLTAPSPSTGTTHIDARGASTKPSRTARSIGDTRSDLSGYRQSTATSSAWQISRIRIPLSAPIRSTSTAVDTDSIESRLTAQRRPIGSSAGSRTTSLGRSLIVVVHGATSARRRRGIAASRDRTTTGRRPISGGSHHHSSPRTGKALTWLKQRFGTRRDRPTRLHRRSGGLRTLLHTWRRFRQTGSDREEPSVPRPRVRHRWFQRGVGEHHRAACGRQSY